MKNYLFIGVFALVSFAAHAGSYSCQVVETKGHQRELTIQELKNSNDNLAAEATFKLKLFPNIGGTIARIREGDDVRIEIALKSRDFVTGSGDLMEASAEGYRYVSLHTKINGNSKDQRVEITCD